MAGVLQPPIEENVRELKCKWCFSFRINGFSLDWIVWVCTRRVYSQHDAEAIHGNCFIADSRLSAQPQSPAIHSNATRSGKTKAAMNAMLGTFSYAGGKQ